MISLVKYQIRHLLNIPICGSIYQVMYSHSTVNMSFVECKGIVQYELMIIICDLKIQKSSTICHTSSQANKILVLRHIVQFQKSNR